MSQGAQPEFVNELADWLMPAARLIGDTATLDQAIIDRLRASGLPIVRYSTGVPSLHPQVDSFSTLWEEGKGLSFRQYRVSDDPAQKFARSPIFLAYEPAGTVRCRLDGPPDEDEYEILAELRAQGLTDYLVIALPFSDGSNKAMSFATDRAGGQSCQPAGGIDAAGRRPVIVSEAFSKLHGGDFEPLGPFTLKGIERPEQVFAPRWR